MSMDPKRLAGIREHAKHDGHLTSIVELLADRDDLDREVERLQAERAAAFLVANQAGETARLALLEAERLRELLDLDAECAECTAGAMDRDKMRKQFAGLAERLRGELDDAIRTACCLSITMCTGSGKGFIEVCTAMGWGEHAARLFGPKKREGEQPETKSVEAILGKLPSDETDAEFLDMLEGEQP